MAYSGSVKFIDASFGEMKWIDGIRFDEERTEAIIATLWVFGEGAEKEHIHFDLGESDIRGEQDCVIVGKTAPRFRYADKDSTNAEYHILVVVPTDWTENTGG
jgi:hypothetical protein